MEREGLSPESRLPTEAATGPWRPPSASDHGVFTPGAVLADRYRIVGLLGRGGMGEVYRADDLKLGQAVALKFLPKKLRLDSGSRERFLSEVRLAREVTHPNVCRVYDVGEWDGDDFLTMEYVDGEDLASLLTRIGRLPGDKVAEIARQLLSGLAAAHARGVLHRDLKPANVMIDGRGQVRIADFGLAVRASEGDAAGEIAGTPTYMAPEQRAGKGTSVRSDLYSAGVILYEIATGKRPGVAGSPSSTSHPSSLVRDLDPALERAILRCLDSDPVARPASAADVLAALPGGDPLRAALAAGETPSPELVAAAGEKGVLAAAPALALLGAVIVTLLLLGLTAKRTLLTGRTSMEKPPEVLRARAIDILRRTGPLQRTDEASWWIVDPELWSASGELANPRHDLSRPTAPLRFVYRQSPDLLLPASEYGVVWTDDPPQIVPGMARVVLDADGRLLTLSVVTPAYETAPPAPPPDWGPFLADAGLDPARAKPVDSPWFPPNAYDAHSAWRATSADGLAVLVTAASFHGRPSWFSVVRDAPPAERRTPSGIAFEAFLIALVVSGIAAGLVIARRNLNAGRADASGALRLAVVTFSLSLSGAFVSMHHVPSPVSEWVVVTRLIGVAFFWNALGWLFYLALEPYVRKRWPEVLVSWSRLLAGRPTDPLVGRDVLIGCLAGALMVLAISVPYLFRPDLPPLLGDISLLAEARQLIGAILVYVPWSVSQTLAGLFALVLLTSLVRRAWLGFAIVVALSAMSNALQLPSRSVFWAVAAVQAVLLFAVLRRFGFLAAVAAQFTFLMLVTSPLTLDASQWYAGRSFTVFAVIAGLSLWGFLRASAGSPLLRAALDD